MQSVAHRQQREPEYLEEARRDKDALAFLLTEKALSTSDTKKAQFYYVVASFLRKLPVKNQPGIILATDGEAFYVGEKYLLAKKHYGPRILPFLWMHEVLHVLHVHPERMKLVDDPILYNIIADLYINEILEHRLGKIPNDFVKLSSFLKFLLEKGIPFNDEEREALETLARLVVDEKVTVEEAYAVIEKIPKARNEFMKAFQKSSFFGKDLPKQGQGFNAKRSDKGGNKQPPAGGSGRQKQKKQDAGHAGGQRDEGDVKGNEEQKGQNKQGGKEHGGEDGEQTPKLPMPDKNTEELKKTLEKLRKKIDDTLSEYKKALGEFCALRSYVGAYPGTEEGVYGHAEYNELMKLRVKLESLLIREIGRVVQEYEVNFSRFDRDAYWLPEDRELFKTKIKVFLDTSGSIPIEVAKLFISWVNTAIKKYNITADVVVFGVGVLAKYEIGDRRKTLTKIPLGGGTVWEETVAKELIKAVSEDVPLVVVLSDFMIAVTGEAWNAIQAFKKRGGKISCWSVYGFAGFCDYRHKFPKLFKALY